MSSDELYPPPLDRLKELGHPNTTWNWAKGQRDYVAELGLAAEHVPGLIRIALRWLDLYDDEIPIPEEPGLWAPVHAWRALGQLRAVEAVEPLLGMMDGLTETDDDWHMEEFPDVFALIGPDATDALQGYMTDPSHGIYPRSVAGSGLVRMAERRPDCRTMAVTAIGSALADYEENATDLNAFFVGHLLRLEAVEQAELIERAFAANRVDDEICGYWCHVREELGVEGLGLAPDEPPRPHHEERFRVDAPVPTDKQERILQRKQKQKLKAKQKQRQKARKRNRKAK